MNRVPPYALWSPEAPVQVAACLSSRARSGTDFTAPTSGLSCGVRSLAFGKGRAHRVGHYGLRLAHKMRSGRLPDGTYAHLPEGTNGPLLKVV